MSKHKEYPDIIEAINDIANDINNTLDDRVKEKYFDGIVLLYSFIENILKSLIFIKLLWDKSKRNLSEKEVKAVRKYCKDLNFYRAQQLALSLDLIDWDLYERLDDIREERNDVIHQFWLYVH